MFKEEEKKDGIFIPSITIIEHPQKGYICIAAKDFRAGELIERCLTIKFAKEALEELASLIGGGTVFHDYNFCETEKGYTYFAMGYGGIYSHSETPNAKWSISHHLNNRATVDIKAIKPIKKGEEITHRYTFNTNRLTFIPFEEEKEN